MFTKRMHKALMSMVLLLTLLVSACSLSSCSLAWLTYMGRYHENAGWHVTMGEFQEIYAPHYQQTIRDLAEQYGIEGTELMESPSIDKDILWFFLYGEEYTLFVSFTNHSDSSAYDYGQEGYVRLYLFYYGSEAHALEDWEGQAQLVEMANKLIQTVGYRMPQLGNPFEDLYESAIETGNPCQERGTDSSRGKPRYYVQLGDETYGYFYQMQQDVTATVPCNRYEFYGLCKPLS